MSRKLALLLLTVVFPAALAAQNERQVNGEYTYYAPQNVSIELAKATAIERAKVQALADSFGTLIDQTVITRRENDNGKSNTSMFALGESTVKGEWLNDTKEPKTEVAYEDDMLIVKAEVWGKARAIKSAPIDIKARVLKNGTLDRFEDDHFLNGDEIYMTFQSPTKGYLAVYLMDADGNANCLLPYTGDTDGMFEVKADNHYVLFSEKHAENGERCDEYVMTCEGRHENNMIYIIFSPNMFVKANDTQTDGKVEVENERLALPRQLPYEDFQRWLLVNRRLDKQMQVVVKGIEVVKE
ncbi:MAG: DUF4384 domain-containing protein [Bacteroidales bacterium]|nr:DUF4384 domain-containing protein [Bacteroidales bacterium]